MAAAKWLRERDVQVKRHPLCWHTACANWLMQYSNDEILRRQLARIHRDATAFRSFRSLNRRELRPQTPSAHINYECNEYSDEWNFVNLE